MSRTRVKICGIRTEAALLTAIEAGADYVGLVFFAKSPRAVDIETARHLAAVARERSRAISVALLVDADDALLDAIMTKVRPDVLQLHGAETPERIGKIRKAHPGATLWKAVSVMTGADVAGAVARYLGAGTIDMLLFDAKPPQGSVLPGGNGLAFDWHILEDVKGRLRFVLAGGLTPDNVAAAIRLTKPAVVDVSSGVESAPGVKDDALIRRFLNSARTAIEAD
jgi:phosphoribosylanthranilate isomerase